ncbi:hypothetical protein ACB092_01G300700 [Castanea dentata]
MWLLARSHRGSSHSLISVWHKAPRRSFPSVPSVSKVKVAYMYPICFGFPLTNVKRNPMLTADRIRLGYQWQEEPDTDRMCLGYLRSTFPPHHLLLQFQHFYAILMLKDFFFFLKTKLYIVIIFFY